MFDNTNHYKIFCRYYAAFKDSSGTYIETEISEEVFNEFKQFERAERNLRRSDERHEEYLEISEEQILRRSSSSQINLEDIVAEKEQYARLWQKINLLPDIQRRRLILYYKYDLTYEQIAGIERCTYQAVMKSVKSAIERIKRFL